MKKRFALMLLVGIFGLGVGVVAHAQAEQCQALAAATFGALESGCAAGGASQACFGAFAISDTTTGTFATVGDTLALSDFTQLATAALDLENNTWGIARLNVPANIPLAVSDTGLIYLLIGDAIIQNTVDPATAFVPSTPVNLQSLVAANIRSGPNTDARVLVSAPAGSALIAEGVNFDRTWLRVVFGEFVGWISSQVVVPIEGDFASLPVVGNDSRTLMQSFSFQNGVEPSDCSDQSPSMLVLQSPNGMAAAITANGADIRFTDTIVLRITADGQLQVTVLAGNASIGILSIPTGFTVLAPIAGENGAVNGGWTNLRPITPDERGFFGVLSLIPETGLYSVLRVPSEDEVTATLVSLNQGAQGSGAGGGSCPGFQALSPLDGLAFGPTTFYWDSLANATQYRLNIFREGGALVKSEVIDSYTTALTSNTADGLGDGYVFAWNIEALDRNGRVMCTTGTVNLLRSAAPQRAGGGGSGDSGGSGQGNTWGG